MDQTNYNRGGRNAGTGGYRGGRSNPGRGSTGPQDGGGGRGYYPRGRGGGGRGYQQQQYSNYQPPEQYGGGGGRGRGYGGGDRQQSYRNPNYNRQNVDRVPDLRTGSGVGSSQNQSQRVDSPSQALTQTPNPVAGKLIFLVSFFFLIKCFVFVFGFFKHLISSY